MKAPVHVTKPVRIPVPGGKVIEEYLGRVAGGVTALSVAHMVAPPGWSEPAQTPEFAEATIMLRGKLAVELPTGVRALLAGESLFVPAGLRVRYGNPFTEECEYFAVCLPAFALDTVHRDAGSEKT